MAEILVHGFGIAGFRSFGYGRPERVGPMTGVHLVAGPNNAGKSNVLSAVARFLPSLGNQMPAAYDLLDVPEHIPLELRSNSAPSISLAIPLNPDLIGTAANGRPDVYGTVRQFADALMQSDAVDADGRWWAEFDNEVPKLGELGRWSISDDQARRVFDGLNVPVRHRRPSEFASDVATAFGNTVVGEPHRNIQGVLERIFNQIRDLPPVQTIPPFRQITPGREGSSSSVVGDGLIEKLGALQHPHHQSYADGIRRFGEVNKFVQDLLEDPAARLEIPSSHDDLYLHHNGMMRPLASYGTGIHQTIILAVAASVLDHHLVCIEEPEIHLHPTMQRKLLSYLSRKTGNQYLIATHSAAMLDAAQSSISSIRVDGGRSRTQPAVEPQLIARLSADLGYRASDLVQSNAVIWVEGPSDRTYLRFWFQQLVQHKKQEPLEEGKHYSIMFYGGALLNHLAPHDPSVEEFISLPRLNRNFAVVVDSDKKSPRAAISATKRRVRDAIQQGPKTQTAWVTAGFTIENYVPPDLLADAVRQIHSSAKSTWNGERYVNPLAPPALTTPKRADKAAVARIAVNLWQECGPTPTSWPLDLAKRTSELLELIRAANA